MDPKQIEEFKLLNNTDELIHYYIRVVYHLGLKDPDNAFAINIYKFLRNMKLIKNPNITLVLFEYHLDTSVIEVKIIHHSSNPNIKEISTNINEYDKLLSELLETNDCTKIFIHFLNLKIIITHEVIDKLLPEKKLKLRMFVNKVSTVKVE